MAIFHPGAPDSGISLGRGGGGLLLRAAILPKGDEINRRQQHGREATIARHIGQDIAREGEQQARAFHQQHGFQHLRRDAIHGENAAIDQFGDEGRGLTAQLRLTADLQRDFEVFLAFLQAAGLDIQRNVNLGRFAQIDENLRRARHFEGQILGVLQIERDGAGRHLPGAIGGCGGGLFGHDKAFRNGGGQGRLFGRGGSTWGVGRQTEAMDQGG